MVVGILYARPAPPDRNWSAACRLRPRERGLSVAIRGIGAGTQVAVVRRPTPNTIDDRIGIQLAYSKVVIRLL